MNAPTTMDPARGPRTRRAARPTMLGELLLSHGALTPEELDAALAERGAKGGQLGEKLLELGFIDEATLLECLSQQLEVPAARLRDGLVDPTVVKSLPQSKAESLIALALFRVRGVVTVAMSEPRDLARLDELERIIGAPVRPVLALKSSIERMIKRVYGQDFAVDAVTSDMADDAVEVDDESIEINLADVQSLAGESPIVNLVNYLIVSAVRQRASDIHIEPGRQHSVVRFRVDGLLREIVRPRKDFHPAIVSRLKVMARLDIAEHRAAQDGRVHVRVEGRDIDLRLSTLPTIQGEKAVMRVLDRRNVTFDLDRLGVPSGQLARVKEMLHRPHGLALVTGPTGSGKTTTLYSALELIKSVHNNVVTVEDPVEYQLERINQVQVGASQAMTFAGALRAILRQDPDVVMLGEIRDSETAAVAVQASLTGHLVLSTLHTNDSAGAIVRMRDMGIESFKIAASLAGVIAQRLVRTICPACRTSHYPSAESLAALGYKGDVRRQFQRGTGCRECHDTGSRGRVGLYETLWASREMRERIAAQADLESLRKTHRAQGGATLLDEGLRLAEEGRVSLEEVARVAFVE